MYQGNFITFLKAISGVAAAASRIYWLSAPNNCALPYITAQQVAGDVGLAHDGDDHERMARIQVDCYAATFAEAATLRLAVEGALLGYRGTMTSTVVEAIFASNPIDFVEDTEPIQFRASEDFEFHYKT